MTKEEMTKDYSKDLKLDKGIIDDKIAWELIEKQEPSCYADIVLLMQDYAAQQREAIVKATLGYVAEHAEIHYHYLNPRYLMQEEEPPIINEYGKEFFNGRFYKIHKKGVLSMQSVIVKQLNNL